MNEENKWCWRENPFRIIFNKIDRFHHREKNKKKYSKTLNQKSKTEKLKLEN